MPIKNYIQKLHKQANMLQWILGRYGFSQNLFEMSVAKNRIEDAPINIMPLMIMAIYGLKGN